MEDSKKFRESIINNLDSKILNRNISKNIEKAIFNFAIITAKEKKIVRKWENKYFIQIYKNRLRSIYLNLNNDTFLKNIQNKKIQPKQLVKMRHQEMCPEK